MMSDEYIRLIDVYPNWDTTGALFTSLTAYYTTDIPWYDKNIDLTLDRAYYGLISGSKIISPVVKRFLVDGELSGDRQVHIANIVWQMYGVNWTKLYKTLSFEYNPIDNYNMTETTEETIKSDHDNTATRTDNTSINQTSTETRTPNITQKNKVYGFNSDSAVDSGESSETGTETNAGTYETKNTGTVANDDIGTANTERKLTLNRTGNIGVTTSQQMIESERDLWIWNFFNTVVFPDVDKVLTLKIY